VNAEEQAATLQRQRVIEEKKMKELEIIREQLERLLVSSGSWGLYYKTFYGFSL
jgi:hypothetical protein